MSLPTRTALVVFALLAVLLSATRVHHFGALPDASWAVFFLAGATLHAQWRWVFPALMALAVGIDWAVISSGGQAFWTHYCVTPAYGFLLPAHAVLWAAGHWATRQGVLRSWTLLGRLALALAAGVLACHAIAQGGFYWFGVANPTLEGWIKNYFDWLLPYAAATALYVGGFALLHALGGYRLLTAHVPGKATA